MDLRDRGGRNRRAECREQLAERPVEGRLHHALGRFLRKRRHLVLQRLEIARQRRADHVRPGRQELAELHVAWPQSGERARKAVRGGVAGRPLDQARRTDRQARRNRQSRGIDQREHALAREHVSGAAETGEVRQTRDHNRQPECRATMPALMRWNDTRRKPAARIIAATTSGAGKRRIDSTR